MYDIELFQTIQSYCSRYSNIIFNLVFFCYNSIIWITLQIYHAHILVYSNCGGYFYNNTCTRYTSPKVVDFGWIQFEAISCAAIIIT